MNRKKPFFLVTVDTEGDNLWSKPRKITTRNADFLPRFQSLCESHELKPSYLTNYEMAKSSAFQEFGKDVLKCKKGEIGMHLHAWNSPPIVPLTKDDFGFHPYLIEYPKDVMQKKIVFLTDLLEDTFGVKMLSHRAGRWSFSKMYAKILLDLGYKVDCSVTPLVSWKRVLGDPKQDGGTDYSQFPDEAYFLNLKDISSPGESSLLEIPVTIVPSRNPIVNLAYRTLKKFHLTRDQKHFSPAVHWLRPNGKNLNELLRIMKQAIQDKKGYVEFMIHSSELMPGGNPTFLEDKNIEALYDDLKILFSFAQDKFIGVTLKEFYQIFKCDD